MENNIPAPSLPANWVIIGNDAAILEQINRWIPQQIEKNLAEDILSNIRLYPQTVPVSKEALLIGQAFQIVQLLMATEKNPIKIANKEQPIGLINIPEAIWEVSPKVADGLFIFLAGANPSGIFDLWQSKDANRKVATLVAFEGQIKPKEKQIAKVTINFGLNEVQKMNLAPDELISIPTQEGQRVDLTIECDKNFKIEGQKILKVELIAGFYGLIFDCRGRPLTLPLPTSEGRERIVKWKKGLNLE